MIQRVCNETSDSSPPLFSSKQCLSPRSRITLATASVCVRVVVVEGLVGRTVVLVGFYRMCGDGGGENSGDVGEKMIIR